MDIYQTPYTYVIGWTHLNKYYYGVRYAKKCNPSDLWISYFTSSKTVKAFREQQGEPDLIQVRKTFDCKLAAIAWEEKVLRRMNVLREERWLNKNIAGAIAPHSGGRKNKGRRRSKEAIAKAIETRKKNGKPSGLKGRKRPEISAALKGRAGLNKGKTLPQLSEEAKRKMLESRRRFYKMGNVGPNKGKVMSNEQKVKISKTSKGHEKPSSHKEKLRAIALSRFKIVREDGSWTWGYRQSEEKQTY